MKFFIAIVFGVAATLGGVGVAYASFDDEIETIATAQGGSQQTNDSTFAGSLIEPQPGAVLWLSTGAAGLIAGVGSVVVSRRRNAVSAPVEEHATFDEELVGATKLVGAHS